MKGKFTQGPWQVKHSESKPAFNVIGTVVGGKYKIARCPYVVTERYPDTDKREKEEGEANARLIAAAPELLEVAQLVLLMKNDERFTKMPEWITIVDKAEEAFLKATGEKEAAA